MSIDRLEAYKKKCGDLEWDKHNKDKFYNYMRGLYNKFLDISKELEKLENWLYKFKGSEYALSECVAVKEMLQNRANKAFERYENNLNKWRIKNGLQTEKENKQFV